MNLRFVIPNFSCCLPALVAACLRSAFLSAVTDMFQIRLTCKKNHDEKSFDLILVTTASKVTIASSKSTPCFDSKML